MPHAPEGAEFVVYHEGLIPSFDIGVEDSEKRRDWLLDMGTFIRMAYPAGIDDGTVFIVSGAVPLHEIVEDFAAFESISVELRGTIGGESITLSIEDNTGAPAMTQFVINLDTTWKTYTFPLTSFGHIDKSILRNVLRFGFSGPCAMTVDVRDVRYLKRMASIELPPVYIYAAGLLAPGYLIGDTTSSGGNHMIERSCDSFTINYPAGEEWGAAFIYNQHPGNFSTFEFLSVEMRSDKANDEVFIGISDTLTTRDVYRPYQNVKLSSTWRVYKISLRFYPLVDQKHLRVVVAFFLLGAQPKTIHFRNVLYLK